MVQLNENRNSLEVEILYPPSNLFYDTPIPVTWTFPFRQTIVFGRPIELRHPVDSSQSIPSCYPLTVLERSDKGEVVYKAFSMCFFRRTFPGHTSVVMDHTTFFQRDAEGVETYLHKLVERCEDIAGKHGAKSIETEVYTRVRGEIAFPSSLSFYDTYNEMWLPEALIRMGFRKVEEKQTLVRRVGRLRSRPDGLLKVRPWRNDAISRLWLTGIHLMEEAHNLPEERIIAMTRFDSLGFWRQSVYMEGGSPFVLVAEKGRFIRRAVGLCYWLPDLYPLLHAHKTRLYYIGLSGLKALLKPNGIGKIFQIVEDPEHVNTYIDLVPAAISAMRSFGLVTCYIGSVSTKLSSFLGFLKEIGFGVAHILWKLRKDLI